MTFTAASLLLFSAFLHALWNYRGKKISPSPTSFMLSVCFAGLIFAPGLFWMQPVLIIIDQQTLGLLVLSCLFQALYFGFLGEGYRHGDMSLIYPLGRSLPVVMVPPVVWLTQSGHELHWLAMTGMAFIVMGCIILPLRSFSCGDFKHYQRHLLLLALIIAASTVGYSVVDNIAMARMREQLDVSGHEFWVSSTYLILQMIGTAIILSVAVLCEADQRRVIKPLLQKHALTLAMTGVCMAFTYGLALSAMAFVDNVGYVVALRQASIPIGVFMGVYWLKESAPAPKYCGVVLISLGLILVSI